MCSNESAFDNLHKLNAEPPQAASGATVFLKGWFPVSVLSSCVYANEPDSCYRFQVKESLSEGTNSKRSKVLQELNYSHQSEDAKYSLEISSMR